MSEHQYYQPQGSDQKLYGKCVLSIRFENKYDYLKWQKYNGTRQWDFIVDFPATMRAEYEFETIADIERMTKKIVLLLQLGFNVYSAGWQLAETKSQLKQSL